ncbi:Hypp3715 [Branchiostoma lanceolatum]|uniref:Hypp3715 protein n=1 Tax=Branchiostoma lanceolatum TaxID=7740 RepID=A0A8K0A3P6_BRALA|nr:Hypp3715 [Branchiostoma lanceolatum]
MGPQSCHLRLQDNGLQINLQQGLLQQKCSAPADHPNGPRVTRYRKDHRKFEACVQYEDGTWDESPVRRVERPERTTRRRERRQLN